MPRSVRPHPKARCPTSAQTWACSLHAAKERGGYRCDDSAHARDRRRAALMPRHIFSAEQPAEERHHRRQGRIRAADPCLNALKRPPLPEAKPHPAPPIWSARQASGPVPCDHDHRLSAASHHLEQVMRLSPNRSRPACGHFLPRWLLRVASRAGGHAVGVMQDIYRPDAASGRAAGLQPPQPRSGAESPATPPTRT